MFKVLILVTILSGAAKANMASFCAKAKVDCNAIKNRKPAKISAVAVGEPHPQVVREYYIKEVPKFQNTVYIYAAEAPGLGYMRHGEDGLVLGATLDTKAKGQLIIGLDY